MRKILFSFLLLATIYSLSALPSVAKAQGFYGCTWASDVNTCFYDTAKNNCQDGYAAGDACGLVTNNPTLCNEIQIGCDAVPKFKCENGGCIACAPGESCPYTDPQACQASCTVTPTATPSSAPTAAPSAAPTGTPTTRYACDPVRKICRLDPAGGYLNFGSCNQNCGGGTQNPSDLNGLCGEKFISTAVGCIPIANNSVLTARILRIGLGVAGGVAVLMIGVASILIMGASNDPRKLQAGKELMGAAIAGVIMLAFSTYILRLIGVDILGIFS